MQAAAPPRASLAPPASRPSATASAPRGAVVRMPVAIPILLYLVACGLLLRLHGDTWLADRLYAWEGGRWALGHGVVTETLLHRGGRLLCIVAWLCVAGACLRAWSQADGRALRRPLLGLLLAVALSSLLIAALKAGSGVDCPWDLARYGGGLPAIGLLEPRPATLPHAACFPAGHAGAGYAWVALYAFLARVRPRWRHLGLAAGLGLGLVFGIAQQLRGAHFLSHDLTSLLLCWLVACAIDRLLHGPGEHPTATAGRAAA